MEAGQKVILAPSRGIARISKKILTFWFGRVFLAENRPPKSEESQWERVKKNRPKLTDLKSPQKKFKKNFCTV